MCLAKHWTRFFFQFIMKMQCNMQIEPQHYYFLVKKINIFFTINANKTFDINFLVNLE